MEAWMYSSTHSSISALDRDERLASRAGSFTLWEIACGTYWTGDRVGTRHDLDAVEKKKILTFPDNEKNSSVVQVIA
jgi:hypothetical protein